MSTPITSAGTPKTASVACQPIVASSAPPTNGTSTVPTLPPAMWALIANPRRSSG